MAGILVMYTNTELALKAVDIFRKHIKRFDFIHSDNVDLEKCGHYDLIFSYHNKKVFPPNLVKNVRCINVHPGYNPYNRGLFPHVWSMLNGLPAGVTIHEMDEKIDNGAIIAREQVEILNSDTSETIYDRIIKAEFKLLDKYLPSIVDNSYTRHITNEPSNFNKASEYYKLCCIDPDKVGTFKEFYDLLRALSHGEYRNAKMGDVYLKLNIYDKRV